MKTIRIAVALLGAALLPAIASATPPAVRHVVSTADLDLRSTAGVERLDRRIALAIATACGEPSAIDPKGANDIRRCRAAAREAVAGDRQRAILNNVVASR